MEKVDISLNSAQSSKLAGGITVILVLALVLFISMQEDGKFSMKSVTNKVANLFEPNTKLISVEAFGEYDAPTGSRGGSMGYWDDSSAPSMTHSSGPPVGGTQSASYQMYQQAVNASTPTMGQLENISNQPGGGYGFVGTSDSPGMVPPAGNGTLYDAAAVDFGNRRAQLISPCAQNAPTFVASSLLPKVNLPGVPSWDTVDTQALAHQDFLAPVQQFGTDTVMSSLRNPSYDLRNSIPNPINVVSPWGNSSITPDLQRRSIDCFVPSDSTYGCGASGATYNPSTNGM
jgi:hypothetical protein